MTEPTSSSDSTRKTSAQVKWLKLAGVLVIFILLSAGLAFLVQRFVDPSKLPTNGAWLAYLIVFGFSILANLTFVIPVPFAVSIMIAVATKWDPFTVALVGAVGGSIGELGSYYAGYIGKKVAIPESLIGYRYIEGWIKKWGVWAISFLAFQPILPFDIGGLVAGTAHMPIRKFLPALFLGKFPKYLLLVYVGIGTINRLPFFNAG